MTGLTARSAIEVAGLRKSFGDKVVLDGIDLRVAEGTVFALLGPNGAGKTTMVQILSTLIGADGGELRVAGHDLVRDPDAVRSAIGVTGQFSAVDNLLTGEENLILMADLHHLDRAEGQRRAAELLDRFDLAEAARKPAGTYSGGMRRRLDLAVSLIATPPVLFLDEPTTGLDPRSRVELWEVLRELVADGTTLLLTTQYLEEADQLSDNIVVIDRGTVIAEGTPLELKDQSGAAALVVTVSHAGDLQTAEALLRPHVREVHVDVGARQLTAPSEGLGHMTRVAGIFDESGIVLDDIGLKRPSLDDVFLHLTGHRAEQETDDAAEGDPADQLDQTAGGMAR
jgi:ABC-2 type transport system ATP-binding protein